jgi:RHS repeat-associated protein
LTAADGGRGPELLQRRSYRYHLDGNVATVVDQLAGAREYDVDPIGRVTAVRGPDWTERYAYDASGNLTFASWPGGEGDATGDREYAGNLIHRAGNARYQHDADGRVVLRQHKTLSSRVRNWRYTWDAEGRLTGVVTPDGQQWHYLYDPLGRRIAKQRLDGTDVVEQVDFVWDGHVLAEQTHRSRTTVWDWEPGGHRPVSQIERDSVDERFYAIVTDLVGTPTELVDADGGLAWRSRDSLWGVAPPEPAGGVSTPLRFPGQYFDQEAQLNYNYHRYYDPASGRYVSNDPLGLAPAPNPQAYVSNPTGSYDPLGLAPYRIYRGMRTEGDLPVTGPTARTLGARPGTDVRPDADGLVHPGGGGISIAPETATNLPSHRRPPEFGGTGRDPVWSIDPDDLPEGLSYRRDSPTSGHGVIEPSRTMTYDEYQSLIESTAGSWTRVDP